MRSALALLAFAFAPIAALASDPFESVSVEQRPESFADAMRKLKPGMDRFEVLRRSKGMKHFEAHEAIDDLDCVPLLRPQCRSPDGADIGGGGARDAGRAAEASPGSR